MQMRLHLHADDVLDIVETAVKERKIEGKLDIISSVWASLSLNFEQHKDTDMFVIKVSEEVMEALEAHQMELQSMIGMGKYVAFFRSRVLTWQKNLGNVETTLKEWSAVTRQWSSLEAIFLGSADIRSQLPDDTKRFESIDGLSKSS